MKSMQEQGKIASRAKSRTLLGIAWLAVLLPVAWFYFSLLRVSTNLPEMDDYDAVLGFMDRFTALHGFGSRLALFVGDQHVQYKLMFQHAVYLLEWSVTGHVNFFFLQQLGNAFVLVTAVALWMMFQPPAARLERRLLLFVPVVLLLFAPRYQETLDWAMGSLQNLSVIAFALLCLILLERRQAAAFAGACGCMVLAIASSGNGFFAAAAGWLFLAQQRRWRRIAVWTGITLCMVGLYLYHYSLATPEGVVSTRHPLLIVELFPLAFLGGAAGHWQPGVCLGLLLLLVAGWLVGKGWRTADPVTFYACVFIGMTTLGVDATRHVVGMFGAVVSRYTIHSQLLMALLYMAAVRMRVGTAWSESRRRLVLGAAGGLALVFWMWTSVREVQLLRERMGSIRQHYIAWSAAPEKVSLVPDEAPGMQTPGMVKFERRAVQEFQRAVELGLYVPPDAKAMAHPAQ